MRIKVTRVLVSMTCWNHWPIEKSWRLISQPASNNSKSIVSLVMKDLAIWSSETKGLLQSKAGPKYTYLTKLFLEPLAPSISIFKQVKLAKFSPCTVQSLSCTQALYNNLSMLPYLHLSENVLYRRSWAWRLLFLPMTIPIDSLHQWLPI